MFGKRHDMLEVPQIPRDRTILQTLINTARHKRRVQRLTRFAAGNVAAWGFYVLLFWRPAQASDVIQLFLPLIMS